MGERARRQRGRVVAAPPFGDVMWGGEPRLAGFGGAAFLARLREGQVEPRRKCCAVGLPLDTQRTTAERHSVDTSPPPHPTPLRLTHRLTGQRASETADIV
ncbi:hypothetical protein CgunFtcFv8_022066 [Champsocephalus gunnari]|uniref:Uncharacterized protein n=1 Tax=Champsocephalus gunnari TaxID=52237 RepID=A0AAN8HX38_CHAGU|nr:hypothetical protein CgunFtcFv8_022066 [Champsocephalus gunnari]